MASDRPGSIPLEDFDGELRRHIEECSEEGRPRLAALDIAEDDPILGYNLGTPGRDYQILPEDDFVFRGFKEAINADGFESLLCLRQLYQK